SLSQYPLRHAFLLWFFPSLNHQWQINHLLTAITVSDREIDGHRHLPNPLQGYLCGIVFPRFYCCDSIVDAFSAIIPVMLVPIQLQATFSFHYPDKVVRIRMFKLPSVPVSEHSPISAFVPDDIAELFQKDRSFGIGR